MQIGVEADALGLEGQVAGVAAVEILLHHRVEMALRLAPERLADVHVLA